MSAATETAPRYTHDHDCTWLGQHDEADLYFCMQAGVIPTVIARLSDEDSDYISGLPLADHNAHLAVARDRAREVGLL